jgi:hypothetical protein
MSGSPDASSASATRASLIAGLRRGDMRAWYEMVDLYAPLVHHWCAQCRIGPDAADDVMQETFAAVARRIEQFEYRNQNDSFRGWLWTVTRNKVRDYRRNRLRQAESVGGSTAMRHLAEYPDVGGFLADVCGWHANRCRRGSIKNDRCRCASGPQPCAAAVAAATRRSSGLILDYLVSRSIRCVL